MNVQLPIRPEAIFCMLILSEGFVHLLSGAFATLLQTAISFAMSVCPSVFHKGTNLLQLYGFSLFFMSEIFLISDCKIPVSITIPHITELFMQTAVH
jgi:hypothetical protein